MEAMLIISLIYANQVAEALCKFFNFNRNVCLGALKRMKDMRKHLEASKFFKTHEVRCWLFLSIGGSFC